MTTAPATGPPVRASMTRPEMVPVFPALERAVASRMASMALAQMVIFIAFSFRSVREVTITTVTLGVIP